MNHTQSYTLFDIAQQYFPGGVNSPVRAFGSVDSRPIFIKSAQGPYIHDEDGNTYIDYVGSWGPMIAGHAHPHIIAAVKAALIHGTSFGACTESEIKLAQAIKRCVPSMELMRFVSSGTEASMSAIRLARGYTNRRKIIKFAGCYHGHTDSLLVASGSGGLTLGIPNSAGVLADAAQHTLIATFNRLETVSALFEVHGADIAAVIVEPVAGNMNCVLPVPGFLEGLRKLCDQYSSVLILDEVITGFRVGLGGAQEHYNIQPDLTVLGKIIGGGFPVGAFGGRAEIMRFIAPLGPVYQAGTLSGNPIAMAAGLANLELVSQPGFYENLAQKTAYLVNGLKDRMKKANIPFFTTMLGGMFGLYFTERTSMETDEDIKEVDVALFKQFFHAMLEEGVYLSPSCFEAGFMSGAHDSQVINKTLHAADKALEKIKVKV
jgi:glutamate-1-semialdehyde 2,1-aminomutase